MVLRFFNTLTRKKENFRPLIKGRVSMYSCGPTVYDSAHIGNLRTFINNDILKRVFEAAGYNVKHVMNITDIDDKTIKRSQAEGSTLAALTQRYESFFLSDLKDLSIKIPRMLPRATDHIQGMIGLIRGLLRDGYAYRTEGGIYFDISKSKGYGRLARLNVEAMTRSRIESDEYAKNDARDFALWKFWTPEDGENDFVAPFGKGRPGWHIECSAMAMKKLGKTIDVHTGGIDLIFPHHTNEIAQSEAATGKQFVRSWIHTAFVMIEGQKMSKSLGNILTLANIKERGGSPLAFRYLTLEIHYRATMNFTWEALTGAQHALEKLQSAFLKLPKAKGSVHASYKKKFFGALADDLNTPKALAVVWQLVKDKKMLPQNKRATLLYFDKVLGLGLTTLTRESIPVDVAALAKEREAARKEKNWARADEIRSRLKVLGYEVVDTAHSSSVRKLRI